MPNCAWRAQKSCGTAKSHKRSLIAWESSKAEMAEAVDVALKILSRSVGAPLACDANALTEYFPERTDASSGLVPQRS